MNSSAGSVSLDELIAMRDSSFQSPTSQPRLLKLQFLSVIHSWQASVMFYCISFVGTRGAATSAISRTPLSLASKAEYPDRHLSKA